MSDVRAALDAMRAAEDEARHVAGSRVHMEMTRRWARDRVRLVERDRATLERHQPTEVYTVESTAVETPDDDESFIRRVQAGSDSLTEGWQQHVVEDTAGNIVASEEPPDIMCTHDVRFAAWPCPEAVAVLGYWLIEDPDA